MRKLINRVLAFFQSRYSLIKLNDNKTILDFINLISPISSEYGLIRIGSKNDGGYLIPDDLKGIRHCYSPGVDNNSSFEYHLSSYGIKSFLADFSVQGPARESIDFYFIKKHIGLVSDEKYITLEEWIDNNTPEDNEMLLQMDIEGSEYDILFSASEKLLKKFRIVVIEFHELERLVEPEFYKKILIIFKKLLKNFAIVHVHANNCSQSYKYKGLLIPPVLEFTFHRLDRISLSQPISQLPHPLDEPNNIQDADVVIPSYWYLR